MLTSPSLNAPTSLSALQIRENTYRPDFEFENGDERAVKRARIGIHKVKRGRR